MKKAFNQGSLSLAGDQVRGRRARCSSPAILHGDKVARSHTRSVNLVVQLQPYSGVFCHESCGWYNSELSYYTFVLESCALRPVHISRMADSGMERVRVNAIGEKADRRFEGGRWRASQQGHQNRPPQWNNAAYGRRPRPSYDGRPR